MAEINRPTLTQYDSMPIWRCPPLGGPVTFEYCRRMNTGLPCRRVFECWGGRVNLEEYLQRNFTPEELQSVFAQPAPTRLETMFSVLAEVEKRKKEQEKSE